MKWKVKMLKKEQERQLLQDNYNDIEENDVKGVLLADKIRYYAKKYKMIDPFNESQLKSAGYELSVGKKYAIDGEIKELTDETGKDIIKLEPFKVAILSIEERINLPRNIIARWDLRVCWVYKGLLWTGAPQIDPGWLGRLFFPIYNLSSEDVEIKLGDYIALIDFTKTSDINDESKKNYYKRPPARNILEDYNTKLKSALFTKAAQRIDRIEEESGKFFKDMNSKVRNFETLIAVIFTSIAILFAALSIFVVTYFKTDLTLLKNPMVYSGIIISIIALAFSIFRGGKKYSEKGSFKIISIIYMILSAIAILYLLLDRFNKMPW